MSLLPLPPSLVPFLDEYLPTRRSGPPFVTLTYAQSLDSKIAARAGVQTKISHLETKTMTHYLRSHHDAILVGVGTVLADDPKLNCRYGNHMIRPVVVDPHGKWVYHSSTLAALCKEKDGLAPYILVSSSVSVKDQDRIALEEHGGKFIKMAFAPNRSENWPAILQCLKTEGIESVMIEGGAVVINDLLATSLVNSLIITIGPVYLGQEGVTVSPSDGVVLKDSTWWTGTSDSVLAARIAN